ncbi:hypothetical protein [Vibrio fluvialis]|uniref:hypothetical protein n=1 Tax=Vibrio fluvialis TaxID=676 RepID=UPI0013024E95|nr:hypothetical protein [Vibrio fluvialis]
MNNEKKGIRAAWKAFGEKTQFLETSGGRVLIAVLAVLMIGWSVMSMYNKNQVDAAGRHTTASESYTLTE